MRPIALLSLLLFCSVGFVIFASCQKSNPPISEKKFVTVYSEMVFMQDTSFLSQKIIRERVLDKYEITDRDYEQTVEYYNQEPVRWQKFFDEVTSHIDSLKLNLPKDSSKSDVKVLPKQSL